MDACLFNFIVEELEPLNISKVDPSKVKFASPFKLVPLPPVITLLSALLDNVNCDGNEVKFAPDPTKLVAVTTPAFPNLILLPTFT